MRKSNLQFQTDKPSCLPPPPLPPPSHMRQQEVQTEPKQSPHDSKYTKVPPPRYRPHLPPSAQRMAVSPGHSPGNSIPSAGKKQQVKSMSAESILDHCDPNQSLGSQGSAQQSFDDSTRQIASTASQSKFEQDPLKPWLGGYNQTFQDSKFQTARMLGGLKPLYESGNPILRSATPSVGLDNPSGILQQGIESIYVRLGNQGQPGFRRRHSSSLTPDSSPHTIVHPKYSFDHSSQAFIQTRVPPQTVQQNTPVVDDSRRQQQPSARFPGHYHSMVSLQQQTTHSLPAYNQTHYHQSNPVLPPTSPTYKGYGFQQTPTTAQVFNTQTQNSPAATPKYQHQYLVASPAPSLRPPQQRANSASSIHYPKSTTSQLKPFYPASNYHYPEENFKPQISYANPVHLNNNNNSSTVMIQHLNPSQRNSISSQHHQRNLSTPLPHQQTGLIYKRSQISGALRQNVGLPTPGFSSRIGIHKAHE